MKTMSAEERIKETRLMMQSLLADRFQMKAHFETREMPVYELLVAKGGPKLKENPDLTKARYKAGGGGILGTAVPIQNLIDVLEAAADVDGRKIVNKTGLTGQYDISLKWTPLQAAAASGAAGGSTPAGGDEGVSFFTALEEQLGLKLVPTKAPGQVLVIDHIERPSEN
jgi:bla regulator protein blaR1